MAVVRWLHFSDLHLNQTGVETFRLRSRLIPYLKSLGVHCDYAFCTGDIRFAPAGAFLPDSGDRVREICAAAGVPAKHIFIVPGNHDIDRGCPGRDEAVRRVWFQGKGAYSPMNGMITYEDRKAILAGEEEYKDFLKQLYRDVPGRTELYANPERPHFTVETEHFNIIHMDSTLTYTKEQERGLIVGTAGLLEALKQLNPDKISVLLTHYSFDYLDRTEQREIAGLFQDAHVQLWLAGHEHDQLARKQWETFYEIQCGNLLLENGAKACVLLGRLDTESGEGAVQVHAWYPQAGWALYPFARLNTGEGEDGSIYPFSAGLRAKPEREQACGARKEVRNGKRSRGDEQEVWNENLSRGDEQELRNAKLAWEGLKKPGGMFYGIEFRTELLPDLLLDGVRYSGYSESAVPLLQAADRLWAGAAETEKRGKAGHALLLGDGGMGKSTALYLTCGEIINTLRIPAVFLSLQMLESLKEGIGQTVMRCLFESTDARASDRLYRMTGERHDRPDLVLLIDGFNELNSVAAREYMTEIKKLSMCPGIQIIISSRADFLRNYGMNHFEMIEVCDLRKEQIVGLFAGKQAEVPQEEARLFLLLKNPMMALLYEQTCSILKRHRDDSLIEWALPVENEADLLKNYYAAQIAGLLERYQIDGRKVAGGTLLVRHILPELAAALEKRGKAGWEEEEFDLHFHDIVQTLQALQNGSQKEGRAGEVRRIYRRLRLYGEEPGEEELYDLLLYEMCLLYHANGKIVFRHQIFRDYMAASFYHEKLSQGVKEGTLPEQWEERRLNPSVLQFVSCMERDVWQPGGIAGRLLDACRGRDAQEDRFGLFNTISCFLPRERDKYAERRLNDLDLREIPLGEYLKKQYAGSILIDGSRVRRETFVNPLRHDRILTMAYSADGRFLAALSANGLVSVTNVRSQLQLPAGTVPAAENASLFYNGDGCLELHTGNKAFLWPDVDYKRIVDISDKLTETLTETQTEALAETLTDTETEALTETLTETQSEAGEGKNAPAPDAAQRFLRSLAENDMAGEVQEISPDRSQAAVGGAGGQIQIWDVRTRTCAAELSLGDASIAAVSFSPDGSLAAVGSGGRLIQIWNVDRERCEAVMHVPKPVRRAAFKKDSCTLVECIFSDQSYVCLDWTTGRIAKEGTAKAHPLNRKTIRKELAGREIAKVDTAPSGNTVIVEKNSPNAWVWDNERKTMNLCPGHKSIVTDAAICRADDRFAATCSNERIQPEKRMRKELIGQRVVRVRIVKTGRCQWRLPTNGRIIKKLRFYTANRIVLAGFAANGDILLWELHNELWYGGQKEVGHWEAIDIVRNNAQEPLECVVPEKERTFIGAYADGTILKRTFDGSSESSGRLFPGIDLSAVKWNRIDTPDEDLVKTLTAYKISCKLQLPPEFSQIPD